MKLLTALACLLAALLVDGTIAGLLRVPKVYNALITTNEKLVPSRAISVSAPVFQPIGLAPALAAVPPVVVTSPYIGFNDAEPKPNKSDEEQKPEKIEEEKKPEDKKNKTANIYPAVAPFSLPVAYYNSLTYYHNLWPYSYSSFSPATFVFTAPFTYPGVFGDYYGSLPWSPVRKPESDDKKAEPEAKEAKDAKEDPDTESVSVESS